MKSNQTLSILLLVVLVSMTVFSAVHAQINDANNADAHPLNGGVDSMGDELNASDNRKPPASAIGSAVTNHNKQSTALQQTLLSATPFATTLAPPQDIASLNAREILGNNSQSVSTVAQMFQNFGLFITVLVSVVGGVVVWLNYLSRKNVHDFVQQWESRLAGLEKDLKEAARLSNETVIRSNEAISRAQEATGRAAASAADAALKAAEIKDHQRILDKALIDIDHLRSVLERVEARSDYRNASGILEQETPNVPSSSEPPHVDDVTELEKQRVKVRLGNSMDKVRQKQKK